MREAVAPGRAPRFADDACGGRFVQHLEQAIPRYLPHALESIDAELPPDDRRNGEHAIAVVGEAVEALADHLADALGDLDAPRLHLLRPLDAALRDQEIDDLADEERVALGLPVDRGCER